MNKFAFTQKKSASSTLRRILSTPGIITGMGIYDAFSARILQSAGAELLFLGGFGATASLLGLPDLSLISATEMTDTIRRITNVIDIPLIADGDTGFGGVQNVIQTVQQFEAAGAAGILLEDQVFPKRCGHFENKEVIPSTEMQEKLAAAVNARQNPDFVIIARTDALAVEGYDATVQRANHYAETGVDLCFVEALQTVEQIEQLSKQVSIPLMANMLWGGKTPLMTAEQLEQLGYKLMAIPIASLLSVGAALTNLFTDIQKHGRITETADQLLTFDEVKSVLNLDDILSLTESGQRKKK